MPSEEVKMDQIHVLLQVWLWDHLEQRQQGSVCTHHARDLHQQLKSCFWRHSGLLRIAGGGVPARGKREATVPSFRVRQAASHKLTFITAACR